MNSKTGRYADGGGLYLQVVPLSGGGYGRSWFFRYAAPGGATRISRTGLEHRTERQMGLGPTHTISLAEAREAAREARKLLFQGVDPLDARDARRASQRVAKARSITFDECAAAFVASRESSWRNEVHRRQWTTTLSTYASPVFGKLPVEAVDTALVMKVLSPLWQRAPETGSRLRGRIESILDWATVASHRTGENPARWRGHIEHLLPKRSKVAKVEHHAAMPYRDVPAFMTLLRGQEGIAATALQFLLLTAARSGEVLGAEWGEVDLDQRMWIIPADRMKAGRAHRVPLSDPAVALLERMPRRGRLIFPGQQSERRLRANSMTDLMRRMGHAALTAHGFRSTFRDWAAEQTAFPNELLEVALAHVVSDRTEAAYRRGDMIEKRRQLMDAWATFCERPTVEGRILPMRRG
jgi:integrase